jgi:hypothetical protein
VVGTTTVHIAPSVDIPCRALEVTHGGNLGGMSAEEHTDDTVAEAASAAARETADAIDVAAQRNRDPMVAKALDDAALKADKTVSRVGWLRALVRRLTSASSTSNDDAAA